MVALVAMVSLNLGNRRSPEHTQFHFNPILSDVNQYLSQNISKEAALGIGGGGERMGVGKT